MGYRVPPYDSCTVDSLDVTLTDTTLTAALPAPGQGKRNIVTWIWAYNPSAQTTGVKLYSGSTRKGTLPAPAGGGAVPPLPTPIVCGENEVFKIQALDVANPLVVTVGYLIAPKG